MRNRSGHMLSAVILAGVLTTGVLLAIVQAAPAADPAGADAITSSNVIYVDRDTLGPAHDGLSWTTAYTNVQDALASATPGDEIWVAEGIYTPTAGITRTATFSLPNGVDLYGGFRGIETGFPGESTRTQRDWTLNVTVLSGDLDGNDTTTAAGVVTDTAHITGANAYHVVSAQSVNETAILDGFTVTAGQANGGTGYTVGGGMYNTSGSNPALTNVTFSGNYAVRIGGGMYNWSSHPTLVNVTFSGNHAGYFGGGMFNNRSSSPDLTNVTFSGNSASYFGGGMANQGSSPTLVNVTFSGNQADEYGGGMINSDSNPMLANVTFSGNSAGWSGGGMANGDSNPVLANVTFSGNQADEYGGGMYNSDSNPTLTNVILWDNTASSGGLQMFNADNSSPLVHYSLIQGGCPLYATCDHLQTADPRFLRDPDPGDGDWTTPGDNDYGDLRLRDNSPAIDAGDNAALPADLHDLDGDGNRVEPLPYDLAGDRRLVEHPRVDTGHGSPPLVDMGAYETQEGLWIEKTASHTLLDAGDPLTYTFIFRNDSVFTAADILITDVVPAHLHTLDFAASGAQITPTGSVSYTWQVEDLLPGEGITIILSGVLSPSLAPGQTFTNTAGFSSLVSGTRATGISNAPVTQCSADLEIGKRADLDPAVAGSPLTYTLVITNHGPTDSLGFVLTDTLPGGMTFISGYPGCHAAAGATVTCNVPFLALGASLAITTVVTAPPTGGLVTNTVTIDGTCPDLDTSNNVATETTYIPRVAWRTLDLHPGGHQPGPRPGQWGAAERHAARGRGVSRAGALAAPGRVARRDHL